MSDKYYTFTDRPTPLYPSYRPMYRVAQILMILNYNGYGGKASLLKLHMFSWALKSSKNMEELKSFVVSNHRTRLRFFGIESTLNRALNLAYAEGLIGFSNGIYSLKDKGIQFADELDKDEELFIEEKQYLKFIGKKVPEKIIKELVNVWKHA